MIFGVFFFALDKLKDTTHIILCVFVRNLTEIQSIVWLYINYKYTKWLNSSGRRVFFMFKKYSARTPLPNASTLRVANFVCLPENMRPSKSYKHSPRPTTKNQTNLDGRKKKRNSNWIRINEWSNLFECVVCIFYMFIQLARIAQRLKIYMLMHRLCGSILFHFYF